MKVNLIEIINILIVLLLMFVLKKKNDVSNLLLIAFIYGSLHFSYALLLYAGEHSANALAVIHGTGSGLLARLSTLVLLGVVFISLGRRVVSTWHIKSKDNFKVEIHIMSVMAIILIAYFLNIEHFFLLQFKNIISIEVMLSILLMGYFLLKNEPNGSMRLTYNQIIGVLVLLVVADFFAFYEVLNREAWAVTPDDSGVLVYRASSILFNPNLLSFWSGLIYLGFAYGFHTGKHPQKLMVYGMILCAIAIYLSGSRSGSFVLLGALFVTAVLIKGKLRLIPFMIFPLSMLVFYGFFAWIIEPLIFNTNLHGFVQLGERFGSSPLKMVHYFSTLNIFSTIDLTTMFKDIPFMMEIINYAADAFKKPVDSSITESIEGRFYGGGVDSGWIVLQQDAGWLGVIAVASLFFKYLWRGARVYYATRSVESVYALAILLFCIMLALVLRFQIFPVWLFMCLMLIPCIVYLERASSLKKI